MKTEVAEAGRCIARLLLLATQTQLKQGENENRPLADVPSDKKPSEENDERGG